MVNCKEDFLVFYPEGIERTLNADKITELADELIGKPADFWSDAVAINSDTEDGGWIHVFFVEQFGWQITCCGDSDHLEHFLIDMEQPIPNSIVEFRKAGLPERFPKRYFVNTEAMKLALSTFLKSKERERRLAWVEIGEDDF